LENHSQNALPWINPIGGLGDILMLSGVLKMLVEKNPQNQFNLVRRRGYTGFLKGHPAIREIGYPPKDATIVKNDYWAMEKLGEANQRAFQILARGFGLQTPVEERLYFPGEIPEFDPLFDYIPWKKKNVIIAPFSESPRKTMHPVIWHKIVESLNQAGATVIQVGKERDLHIHNTFSVTGLTSIPQLISLVRKTDLLISSDNFVMHIAHMLGKKALVFWGPTSSRVYGYPEHIHVQAPLDHCPHRDQCLGPGFPQNYGSPCPLESNHCLQRLSPEMLSGMALKILQSFSAEENQANY